MLRAPLWRWSSHKGKTFYSQSPPCTDTHSTEQAHTRLCRASLSKHLGLYRKVFSVFWKEEIEIPRIGAGFLAYVEICGGDAIVWVLKDYNKHSQLAEKIKRHAHVMISKSKSSLEKNIKNPWVNRTSG